jgi:hypothetical protein
LICDKNIGAGVSALARLIIFTNPQSSNNFTMAFLRDRSFSEISVGLPSKANSSLKCTI